MRSDLLISAELRHTFEIEMDIPELDADHFPIRTVVDVAGTVEIVGRVMEWYLFMQIDVERIGFWIVFKPRHVILPRDPSALWQSTTARNIAGTIAESGTRPRHILT